MSRSLIGLGQGVKGTARADGNTSGRCDPDEVTVGPEPEQGGEHDAGVQRDEARQLVVSEAQQVVVERHRRVLDQQGDPVQHGEDDDLAHDAGALPVPERPVAVAQVAGDRRDDGGDRGGRDRPHAKVDEQQVVDAVGDEHAGDADHRELGELVDERPESLVLRSGRGHRLSHRPGSLPTGCATRTGPGQWRPARRARTFALGAESATV
jgi:hypothetical protein